MKRNHNSQHHHRPGKWIIIPIFLLSILLLLLPPLLLPHTKPSSTFSSSLEHPNFTTHSELVLPKLPRFAYLLTGTKGDGMLLKRVLQAAYHPRNYYLLHLDLEASDEERLELAKYVKSESVFGVFGNVMVVGKADLVTYKGPTMIASTLHGVALMLKRAKDWDWFVNLGASDYPLVSQDGK